MNLITEYLKTIESLLKSGDSTELSHRSALQKLIMGYKDNLRVISEPKHIECGAPDLKISTKTGELYTTTGYIETKDIGRSLDEAEKSGQLKRYLLALPNLILTDYLEFRWYIDGERRMTARLAAAGTGGSIKKDKEGAKKVEELITAFLAHEPPRISKPEELAQAMARLTHIIRDVIKETFDRDKASSDLAGLRTAFAKVLIHDIEKPEKTGEFADMYAQSLAYGLFAARCNHKKSEPFTRRRAAEEIPKTNPFLRKLFDTITGIELADEPYVGFVDDLVNLLDRTDMRAVLQHFGKKKKGEDPIIHFYETFLAAYDKKLRKVRGVYYTPEPVISYIVRSVDYILKDHFGLSDGLADTSTTEYKTKDDDGNEITKESPRVLILDPAGGTGSFLYQVIDLIRSRFMESGNAGMWSGYVRKHLLPRLFSFELLMAPYAVAHLKLGMQLAGFDLESEALREKWAYDFDGDERLNIFLTNTLEEAEKEIQRNLIGLLRIISEEADNAKEIKEKLPIMIIMGNPPYSGISANKGKWIDNLLKGKIPVENKISNYYEVDGKPLKEKKVWLQDDYVKFIRWAQWRIEKTGSGVLAFITNHGYIDNPTFRGMRESLLKTFDSIYIVDLHGNVKKKETSPDGSKDENVFDIQQGVAIGIFIKGINDNKIKGIYHFDLYGERANKYKWLQETSTNKTKWKKIKPKSPYYFFIEREDTHIEEYQRYDKITNIFSIYTSGIVTAKDHFVIDFEEKPLKDRINQYVDNKLSDKEVVNIFNLKENYAWRVSESRKDLSGFLSTNSIIRNIKTILYRPFDKRKIFHHPSVVWRTRDKVMRHMLEGENVGIIVPRQTIRDFKHVLVTDTLCNFNSIDTAGRFGSGTIFPLYLYPFDDEKGKIKDLSISPWSPGKDGRLPNLDPMFVDEMSSKLGLEFVSDGAGDLKKTYGPEDILHYIYAVFHSPTYRERYSEFLKIDFPRVPLTSDRDLFRELCNKGSALVRLHLLEDISSADLATRFPVTGDNIVEKGYPKYMKPGDLAPKDGKELEAGRVYINKTQYFDIINREVWEFHIGGYQVLSKWLKDRRGRTLDYDDIIHYQKVVFSLGETIRLMNEIDSVIPKWPIE